MRSALFSFAVVIAVWLTCCFGLAPQLVSGDELPGGAVPARAAAGDLAGQSLDDLIERHRVPFPNDPSLRREKEERWYWYGVFFCSYDADWRPGEPASFPLSGQARAVSDKAFIELSQRGIWAFRALAREPDLYVQRVCFDANWSGEAKHLEQLPYYERVVTLCFYYANLTDEHVALLQPLKTLTDLEFRHTGITDKALASLASIKSLRRLTFVEDSITPAGIRALLAQLPKLKQVRIDATHIGLDHQQEQSLGTAFPHVKLVVHRDAGSTE